MKLIVGLGNPTVQYAGTRHNVGFDTITRLCDTTGIKLDHTKAKALIGRGIIGGEKVILAQPQTYMNLSGEACSGLLAYFKLTPADIIVIYDDTSLPVGRMRIREKGSAGGHNGIKNIIALLGTDCFLRVKVGIGEKPRGWDLADYVLSRFNAEEEPLIREQIAEAAKAVECLLTEGTEATMNLYNRKKESEQS